MDPGRDPLRIFLAHPLDEITQATIDLRAPCPLSGFPAPESFEAGAMPPKNRFRLNHRVLVWGRSGRQLTPLGQGGRTVLFEDIAVVEVTVVVEVVVD